jgi:hypothetical protein
MAKIIVCCAKIEKSIWTKTTPASYNAKKLEFHLKSCDFFGYSYCHKGYKCLDVATGHVYISHRDAVFDENVFPFA